MVNRVGVGITSSAIDEAIAEWTTDIGRQFVVEAGGERRGAETATFATTASIHAILRPANRDEVQKIVRTANRFRIAIYPISTGRNWGYGSRVPVTDSVLLDLSRLNRIVDFSEDLAYVTLEPGVTQRQLHEFLTSRKSRLWMDATGSSADCSVIGNTMERGFGHTPMGDHCSTACGFEVVLPTGACIETGFCRFPGSKAGALLRWGLGPSIDGLFTQSNLGIVTRMSVWLMPAPSHFEAFFFQTDQPIAAIVDALRPLRQNGTLRSVVHVGNDYKVISGTGQFPWSETASRTPLDPDTMAHLRQRFQIARWNGSGALYGTRSQVQEAKVLLRRALTRRVERLRFVSDKKLSLAQRFEKSYRRITGRHDMQRALNLLPPLLSVLKGVPDDSFLRSAYWRKKEAVPSRVNPDRDRCGLLWCSPVAPMIGSDVELVTQIAVERALTDGFEPIISVSLINERATLTTIALTYDRDVPGEDERAFECYRGLTERLLAVGYPPYRLNVAAMDYSQTGGAYDDTLRSIKLALDPNGVLAPGRYQPK